MTTTQSQGTPNDIARGNTETNVDKINAVETNTSEYPSAVKGIDASTKRIGDPVSDPPDMPASETTASFNVTSNDGIGINAATQDDAAAAEKDVVHEKNQSPAMYPLLT